MPRTVKIEAECPPAFAACPQRAACDQVRRRALIRQLQQAQQMAPVATIAAGLAHDFKNLMTTIGLHSELIGMSLPPDSPQQQNLNYVREAMKQSNELLERLLTVVRPQKGRAAVLRADEELAAMERLIRGVAGPKVEVVMELDATVPVCIDRTELQQVVLNCVSNATQAMNDEGSIEVRVRKINLSNAAAGRFEPPVAAGPYVELSIKDTGPGMRRSPSRRRGTRHAAQPAGAGWGIGLTVVQACAVRARGAVRITSRPGRGTCVTIVLPVANARRVRREKFSVVRSS